MWVVWTVLTIFAGVLASALVTQQLGLERRKRLLRRALKEVVDKAVTMRDGNASDGDTLIWSLEIEKPLGDNPAWNYYMPLNSAENIYTAVRWARNDQDLDEAQERALALMARISDWQAVLRSAQALETLSRGPRERPGDWTATRCAFDTEVVLHKARHEPPDEAARLRLVEEMLRQAAWHRAFAGAWDLRARLLETAEGGAGDITAGQVDAAAPLSEIDAEAPPAVTRTQEQQNEWEVKLARAYAALVALSEQSNRDTRTAEVELPEPSTAVLSAESQAARFDANAKAIRSADVSSTAGIAELDVHAALAMDEIPPAGPPLPPPPPATGAAVVAAGPHGRRPPKPLARRRPASAARSAAASARATFRPRNALRKLWLTDWLTSLAILVLSSVVYTATVYNDTWGTVSDFATAFGAGFSGHAAIKWGLLPIYRSIRLRTVSLTSGGQVGDGGEAASGG